MVVSFTIPSWTYELAIPGWLAVGVFVFYAGGAIYAWFGRDQKANYWHALCYQWGRVGRIPIGVLLWPLAIVELYEMFKRRSRRIIHERDRYAR